MAKKCTVQALSTRSLYPSTKTSNWTAYMKLSEIAMQTSRLLETAKSSSCANYARWMALATTMANWLAMLASSSRKSSVWRIRSCGTSLLRFSATFKISSKCKKAHTSADMKTTHTSKLKLSLQIFSKVQNKFTVKTSTLSIHSSTRSSSSSTQKRRPAPPMNLTSSGHGMLKQTRGSWLTPNSQDKWLTIWT